MCSGRLSGRTGTFDIEPELGCDGDLVAEGRERLSDKLFVRIGAVHLGGVEERDAFVVGRANGSDALVSVRGRSVVGADAHAPSAQFRDFQRSESSGLHVVVAPVAGFLGCCSAHAANNRGPAASPAPMRAVLAMRSRRLIPRTSFVSVTSGVSFMCVGADPVALVGLHPENRRRRGRWQWLVIHVLAAHPNTR